MIAIVLASILAVQVAPSERVRYGAVAGTLQTIDGAPAIGVRVAAIPELTGVAIPEDGPNYYNLARPVSTTLTNSGGSFLLENVPPGRYYILGGLTDQPTYYPSGNEPRGSGTMVVTVEPSRTVDGVDFQLMWPIGNTVSGRLRSQAPTEGLIATLSGRRVEELLETPVAADGSFHFGSVLPGFYLVSFFPPPPGFVGEMVRVEDADVTGLELTAPPTHSLSGRIVVEGGTPVPRGILGFYTSQSYVSAVVHPDATFTVDIHAGSHRIDLAGLPVGYRLVSARIGAAEASEVVVSDAAVEGLVITVAPPQALPELRGRIMVPEGAVDSRTVELTGPIFGTLEAEVQADGSFDFGRIPPGLYVLQTRGVGFTTVAVDGQGATEIELIANR